MPQTHSLSGVRLRLWGAFGFFIAFFVLLLVWTDSSLLYFKNSMLNSLPVCGSGESIFSKLPAYPGMAADYLAGLLGAYLYLPWVGASFFTLAAFIAWFAAGEFSIRIGVSQLQAFGFLPGLLILASTAGYTNSIGALIANSIGLLSVVLSMRLHSGRYFVRMIVFFATASGVYVLAGQAYWIFVSLVFLFEWRVNRGFVRAFYFVLIAGFSALLMAHAVYHLSVAEAFRCSMFQGHPGPPLTMTGILAGYGGFIIFPVMTLISVLRKGSNQLPTAQSTARRYPAIIETTICLLVLFATAFASTDYSLKKQLRVRRFAEREQWQDLLAEARTLKPGSFNELTSHEVGLALFNCGGLLSDFFSFPQNSSTLFLDDPSLPPILVDATMMDTYYALGHLNLAEYEALQTNELSGGSPRARKRLAMIYLAKNRLETARVYLRSLCRDPHYRAWALVHLPLSENDSTVALDPEVQRIRSVMVTGPAVLNEGDPGEYLELALQRNPRNRMAIEFSIIRGLLAGDCGTPLRYLDQMIESGSSATSLPRHCEEALLLYGALMGKSEAIGDMPISQASITRFLDFMTVANPSAMPGGETMDSIRVRFGDTYWFYWLSQRNKAASR